MKSLVHLSAECRVSEIVDEVRHSGAVVVDRLVAADVVRRLASEIGPYLDATPSGDDAFSGRQTRRVGALIARSPTCRELALHPLVRAACDAFLGPFGEGVQLHFTQAVRIEKGQGAQWLHRDRGVWGGRIPRSIEPQFSTIWAVTDFTRANGATRVIPGSSAWHRERAPVPDEICHAEMDAGSVLLYTGSVLHGGGANETTASRVGVLLHYALDWLRQEENQYLSCPPHVARDLEPELRSLLGYASRPLMGFYSPPLAPGVAGELLPAEAIFDEGSTRCETDPSR